MKRPLAESRDIPVVVALARLVFWWVLAWPSYCLYRLRLPSGYGYVSAKHMRALIDTSK